MAENKLNSHEIIYFTSHRLILGNWWTSAGQGEALTHVDLDLKQHGEGGTPPTDYAFIFTAGQSLLLCHEFRLLLDFLIVEFGLCNFYCNVDGPDE